MSGIFTWLNVSINGSLLFALLASFIWGMLSILLSPCHLSSIPLVVGFISGQKETSAQKSFYISSLFSLGMLITIAFIGFITAILGRMLGDIGSWGNYLVAIVFFVVGLYMLGIIPLPFLNGINQPNVKRKTHFTAFVLGLIFGIALGPCTFAYMAPVLGASFKLSSQSLFLSILVIAFYGLGTCAVIVFVGTFTGVLKRYLRWTAKSKTTEIVKKVCGILVILAGFYLIYKVL